MWWSFAEKEPTTTLHTSKKQEAAPASESLTILSSFKSNRVFHHCQTISIVIFDSPPFATWNLATVSMNRIGFEFLRLLRRDNDFLQLLTVKYGLVSGKSFEGRGQEHITSLTGLPPSNYNQTCLQKYSDTSQYSSTFHFPTSNHLYILAVIYRKRSSSEGYD